MAADASRRFARILRTLVPTALAAAAAGLIPACHLDIGTHPESPSRVLLSSAPARLVVRWTAVDGADDYRLFVASEPGVGPATIDTLADGQVVETSTPSATLSLDPAKTWHLAVTARAGATESAPSPELSAQPLPDAWFETTPAWTAVGENDYAYFGGAVAVGDFDGDGVNELAVGESGYIDGGLDATGRVLLFHAGANASTAALFTLEGANAFDRIGSRVAAADYDGNGVADLVVTADGSLEAGTVILGSRSGLLPAPPLPWCTGNPNADVGNRVAAGDLDGDGYDELVFAGFAVDTSDGDAVVVRGGAAPCTPLVDVPTDPKSGAGGGAVIADVTGDGIPDLVLGAPDGGTALAGEVRVYPGPAPDPASWLTVDGGTASDARFGSNVFDAGDVDGDGIADLLALVDPGYTSESPELRLITTADGALSTGAWVYSLAAYPYGGAAEEDWEAMKAGDLDGDGRADVLVADQYAAQTGRVLLFLGTAGGLSPAPAFEIDGSDDFGDFGAQVAIGDLDGDGRADLVVGADTTSPGPGSNVGEVFLYRGLRHRGPRVDAGPPVGSGTQGAAFPAATFEDPDGGALGVHCTVTIGGTSVLDQQPCVASDLRKSFPVSGKGDFPVVMTVVASDGAAGTSSTVVHVR